MNFDPVAVTIHELILQTEVELRSVCIVCGAASEINNDQGPWASLCAEHRVAMFAEDPFGLEGAVWAAARLREPAR
ncbi:hypothetical protein [Variovorax sp. YR216]|uniref:hypothetical protein n=1 Tax=Variovorax sp. YR216 TaxID=1882828 RepID=UPI00115FA46C|nr:hypothetical protein [Variovorax sp. YR216]